MSALMRSARSCSSSWGLLLDVFDREIADFVLQQMGDATAFVCGGRNHPGQSREKRRWRRRSNCFSFSVLDAPRIFRTHRLEHREH